MRNNSIIVRSLKIKYGKSFLFSCVVHLALIILLLTSIQTSVKKASLPKASGEIVQATVVDEKRVQTEAKRLETQENQKKLEEQKQAEMVAHKEQQAAQDRAKEQAKLLKLKQELEKTKEDEQNRLAEIRLAKEKEKKELESLKEAKAKEEKRLAALDEKRQEEQERATQMRLEREKEERKKKEKAALANKQKLEEEKKQAALQAQEDARLAQENAQRNQWVQGEFNKYESMVKDKVKGCWLRPMGLPSGLKCKLEINAMPDGDVVNVKVIQSSGNEAFDQSAIAAVRKAVPLPFPKGEPDVMDLFRHFTFEFIPDDSSEVVDYAM